MFATDCGDVCLGLSFAMGFGVLKDLLEFAVTDVGIMLDSLNVTFENSSLAKKALLKNINRNNLESKVEKK
jgi:hypothetical protein